VTAPIRGRVVRIGHDVDTDVMLPGAYLNLSDRESLAPHLFENYDPAIAAQIASGDVIVAGRNCGTGSSREHAPLAMLGRGVQAIIAESFARIFLRNCINLGLPVVEHEAAARALRDGEIVTLDLEAGWIRSDAGEWTLPPRPAFIAHLLEAGGLVPWVQTRLAARRR
jgi:3-isopropylmalate/(R)-2-methylmalate dehydratase small subunit